MVTSGPGATNVVTPLADAYMDSIPFVCVTGQVDTSAIGTDAFQECDTTGITLGVTKHNWLVTDAADIPRIVREAFHVATTGRPGPVLIDVPKDVSNAMMEWYWPDGVDLPGYRPASHPDPAAIEAAALLVLAEIGARAAGPSDSIAPPTQVAAAFVGALADGSLIAATRDTLGSAFGGLAIGASLGLVLGIVLGSLRALDRLMELALELLRPIPSVAVIPIALVALGFGYRLEIVIVSVACFWPLLILARAAVGGVEPRLIEVARALRLSPLQRTIKIVAPAALPRIFIAFRLAAGISLIVAVTVEIAVNPQGLGYEVMTAGQALRPELMLAYLAWIGIVGFALNAALIFAQNRLFGEAGRIEAPR